MERGEVPKGKRKGRTLKLLESVGLEDKADRRPNRLSAGGTAEGGHCKALANGPAIILADEPTENLDSRTGREIVQLLRKLSREEGITIILVTHDRQMASPSNRMLFLRDGKLLKKRDAMGQKTRRGKARKVHDPFKRVFSEAQLVYR